MKHRLVYGILAATLFLGPAYGRPDPRPNTQTSYYQVVRDTAGMVGDGEAQRIARSHGLQVLSLTWEDTGRYKGSCVGPNISDMTLQVQVRNPHSQQQELVCLPVIRFPNFSDKTADLRLDHFYVLVGNEKKGRNLRKVTLLEYLGNFREHMSKSSSWKGPRNSLLAERDKHVLVSAQACFLPIPKQGLATFNPVLFNYQSYKDNPAVLSIIATREGTSATIIDNVRDGFSSGGTWGQRLFFNHKGQRSSFTGQRLSDFVAKKDPVPLAHHAPLREPDKKAGLNMVLLIQVPLKQKVRPMRAAEGACVSKDKAMPACTSSRRSDVEVAVVGHGKVEGPYTEVDNLAIERDPKFPIRVTVQFYKATSNGVVSGKDLAQVAAQLNQVYANGDYVGSLVTGGDTGRPTEYHGDKTQPDDWWERFWERHNRNQQPPRLKDVPE